MWDFITASLFILTRAVEQGTLVTFVLIGFIGLCGGSFLSVVVYRMSTILERMEDCGDAPPETSRFNIATPASHCQHCGNNINWYQNIPILSYIVMRGKCMSCGSRISVTYPALELLMCIASIVALWQFRNIPLVAGALVLSGALICVSVIDIRERFIPDNIILPMLWLGLICNAFELFTPLRDAVFGAVAGYLSLWGVFYLYRISTGKDGMGHGDFKLLAMLGAWLGITAIPIILIISFTTAAIVGILCMVKFHARMSTAIPFGPFLATAGWCTLYWANEINQAYWNAVMFFSLR